MNKRMLFSYLLSLVVCSFTAQAMTVDGAVEVEQSYAPEEFFLPVLAKCIFDVDGNIVEITEVVPLDSQKIAELYNHANKQDDQANAVTFNRSATLILYGTFDVIKGFYVGSQCLLPYIITFSEKAWSMLTEKYEEYMVQERVTNFTKETWSCFVAKYNEYMTSQENDDQVMDDVQPDEDDQVVDDEEMEVV